LKCIKKRLREISSKWRKRLKRTAVLSSRGKESCDLTSSRKTLNRYDFKKAEVESSLTRPDLIRFVAEWKPPHYDG